MFRLLVGGGRDYYNYKFIDLTLTNWYDEVEGLWKEGLTVVHGDAAGADRIAAQWAKDNSCPTEAHPADWQNLGKSAGHIRNAEMAASEINYAILFPGGVGTASMKHELMKAKIEFREVFDNDPNPMYTIYG
jgi:hypothetical protein